MSENGEGYDPLEEQMAAELGVNAAHGLKGWQGRKASFPPEGYDTEEETAAELDVTPRTLKRWRFQRIGPPVTYAGRKPIYNRQSKRRWLESREMKMPCASRRA